MWHGAEQLREWSSTFVADSITTAIDMNEDITI